MGLKETLEGIQPGAGRGVGCAICALIESLPPDEAAALTAVTRKTRRVGPKPIAAALEAEGYPGLYHSVKHHLYVCQAGR